MTGSGVHVTPRGSERATPVRLAPGKVPGVEDLHQGVPQRHRNGAQVEDRAEHRLVRHRDRRELHDGAGNRQPRNGEQTGGAYCLADATVPPGGGPPPHYHTREEETFYVTEGEITFTVDGQKVTGTPGTTAEMKPGDVVEVEIEKLGVLRNPVVAEAAD